MVCVLKVVMIGADRSVHGGVSAVVNNYYKEGLDKKINLLYIGTMVDGSKFRKLLRAFYSYLHFLTALPKMDILHVNMAADASFYRKKVFIDTAALFHKKILIHEHGGDFQGFYYNKSTEKGRKIIRKTLNKAQIFVVLSQTWADFFKPIVNNEKIIILENAVPIPPALKTSYDDHNLLFLGRLCKEKGIMELLDAISIASQKYPDIRLYLGGIWEDDDLKNKAAALKKHVKYLGWIDDKKKERCMEKCSVFVLPTYFEGQPISLLEAMAKGMTVVSTEVGGIPQIVTTGQDGVLIPPKDTQALAEGICELLDDADTKKRLGINARARATQSYNMRERVNELVAIYEKMMQGDNYEETKL
ncbi:MAG: glycosyltransferase family 4 protein [Lachnospiraceae bacterium]|nr:glycosyltransferase family 4 protein [Lachnospiraceae bacterium]